MKSNVFFWFASLISRSVIHSSLLAKYKVFIA